MYKENRSFKGALKVISLCCAYRHIVCVTYFSHVYSRFITDFGFVCCVSGKKSNPKTMYDRNGKSERILIKLHIDIAEYIPERIIKFRRAELLWQSYSSLNLDDTISLFPIQRSPGNECNAIHVNS